MSDVHDLAVLYVVDALDPEETQEFEAHLAGCPDCQREVNEMRAVTAQLSRSVQASPPASLRAAILAQIAQSSDGAPTAPAAASASQRPDNVTPLPQRRPSRLPYLIAAASVLLAVGFGGWALQTNKNADEASGHYTEIAQLLATPDVKTLSGTVQGGGSATVVLSQARNKAVFVASGMPALSKGEVYELWTISGPPEPAGTFTASDAPTVVDLPDAALSAAKLLMTVEPSGGSDRPTSRPLMSVTVPA